MQETSAALIEQLVYFDNFMLNQDTPNLDLDGQISLDLAAFADESFIFADEDKPEVPNFSDNEDANANANVNANANANADTRSGITEGQSSNRPLDMMDSHDNDVGFREGNLAIQAQPRNEGNFSADNNSSLSFDNPWYHSVKPKNEQLGHHSNSGRNQLHSLLNDKIETTKRNKFHSHVGHGNGTSSDSIHEQQQQQHQQFHDSHITSETFADSGPTHARFVDSHSTQERFTEARDVQEIYPNSRNPSRVHVQAPAQEPPQTQAQEQVGDEKHDAGIPDLTNLPKYPVPPGAKSSLKKAGLSQNQIDLLSALIAQHQTSLLSESGSGSSAKENSNTPASVVPTLVSHAPQLTRASSSVGITESPVSNYGSEHSNGSTMSIVKSEYNEPVSSNVSDAYVSGNGLGPDPTKRKRNTAASARFRIKKKMKEKEMETKISQLSEMISKFELRIDELEMENRFLKNLVIEKGNRESDQELQMLKDKAKYVDLTE